MSHSLFPHENLDQQVAVRMSSAMYRGLVAMFVASGPFWLELGFETWLREYLRGFVFGPGIEGGDYADHQAAPPQ